MVQYSKYAKNADYNAVIGDGMTQHLTFNPSKDFAEGDVTLFGITVRQQGRKLIIITKIYEEKRRDEIIYKLGIMVAVMKDLIPSSKSEVYETHIVDQRDILEQLSKRKMTADKLKENIGQEQDVTVEAIDLITGEMVPVEFSMKLLRVEKVEK